MGVRRTNPDIKTWLNGAAQVSFGTADADITNPRISLPSRSRIVDFGIAVTQAQAGGSSYLVGLQKAGTTTFVSQQANMTSVAAGAEGNALGNGTDVNEGDVLEFNVDVTGTVTTALIGVPWIRYIAY